MSGTMYSLMDDLSNGWNAGAWPSTYNLLITLMVLFVGIIVSVILGRLIIKIIRPFISKRIRKYTEEPILRFMTYFFIVLSFFAAVQFIGLDMQKKYSVYGAETTLFNITWYMAILATLVILVFSILPSIIEGILKAVLPSMRAGKRKLMTRKFMGPTYIILIIIFTEILVQLFPGLKFQTTIITILNFALIVFGSIIIGRIISLVLKLSMSKSDILKSQESTAVEKASTWFVYLIGITIAFSYIGLDIWAIATSLGLIGFAVAFGLQSTIADITSGFVISAEKPFNIGDRIVINMDSNETYGDVMDIGMRSTKIRTIENQIIYIPNSLIAREMIWNLSAENEGDNLIIRVPVGISYDSDWRLAERIMLDAAREHPGIQKDPKPHVLIVNFGSSAIEMELWAAIKDSKDLMEIRSDILKRIKDRFDELGVEIPYNYNTLVWKKDLPRPNRIDDVLPKMNIITDSPVLEEQARLKILIPSAGAGAVRATKNYILSRFNPGDELIILYVKKDETIKDKVISTLPGIKLLMSLEKHGFIVKGIIRSGDIVKTILNVAEKEKVDLIVMGATRKSTFKKWLEGDVVDEVTQHANVPTVVVPFEHK